MGRQLGLRREGKASDIHLGVISVCMVFKASIRRGHACRSFGTLTLRCWQDEEEEKAAQKEAEKDWVVRLRKEENVLSKKAFQEEGSDQVYHGG